MPMKLSNPQKKMLADYASKEHPEGFYFPKGGNWQTAEALQRRKLLEGKLGLAVRDNVTGLREYKLAFRITDKGREVLETV